MAQENRLSPPCQEFIGKARTAQSAFFACAADAQRLCADVEPGGGRIAACLGAKRDLVSPDCAHALDEARQVFGR
jgi:hypothetical protein